MFNNKKLFILIEILLAAIVVILAFFMIQEKKEKDLNKISVILPDPDHEQWASFKYGLKMAAEDQDVDIFLANANTSMTLEEEKAIIEQEIASGADALIIQPIWGDNSEELLQQTEKKLPVMLIESANPEDSSADSLPTTQPDQYKMGMALIEELLKDFDHNLTEKTIGIFSETTLSPAIQSREKGVRDALKHTGCKILWSTSESLKEGRKTSLNVQPSADFIIALDTKSLVAASEYSAANALHGAVLYGIGNSTKAVYYLDTGIVQCLAVPDGFNVGYQSLTEAAKNLNEYFYTMENHTISYTILRRDTLFTKENQELIYTMSQ